MGGWLATLRPCGRGYCSWQRRRYYAERGERGCSGLSTFAHSILFPRPCALDLVPWTLFTRPAQQQWREEEKKREEETQPKEKERGGNNKRPTQPHTTRGDRSFFLRPLCLLDLDRSAALELSTFPPSLSPSLSPSFSFQDHITCQQCAARRAIWNSCLQSQVGLSPAIYMFTRKEKEREKERESCWTRLRRVSITQENDANTQRLIQK